MSDNDELELEWTVKDVDKAFLDAALGQGENKAKRPNALELLKSKTALDKVRNGNQS